MIECTLNLTVGGWILIKSQHQLKLVARKIKYSFTCACADNITEHRVANDTKYEHQDIQTYGGCSEIVNVLVEERRKGEYPSLILT